MEGLDRERPQLPSEPLLWTRAACGARLSAQRDDARVAGKGACAALMVQMRKPSTHARSPCYGLICSHAQYALEANRAGMAVVSAHLRQHNSMDSEQFACWSFPSMLYLSVR